MLNRPGNYSYKNLKHRSKFSFFTYLKNIFSDKKITITGKKSARVINFTARFQIFVFVLVCILLLFIISSFFRFLIQGKYRSELDNLRMINKSLIDYNKDLNKEIEEMSKFINFNRKEKSALRDYLSRNYKFSKINIRIKSLSEIKSQSNEKLSFLFNAANITLREYYAFIESTGLKVSDFTNDFSHFKSFYNSFPFFSTKEDNINIYNSHKEIYYLRSSLLESNKAMLKVIRSRVSSALFLKSIVSTLPIESPLSHYRITSPFGNRFHPIYKCQKMHAGLDMAGKHGASVFVKSKGRVVNILPSTSRSGNTVDIVHGHGIKTRYAHLKEVLVKKGEEVDYGRCIGTQGKTGKVTGSHLHYEILLKNRPLNPIKFIYAKKDAYQAVAKLKNDSKRSI